MCSVGRSGRAFLLVDISLPWFLWGGGGGYGSPFFALLSRGRLLVARLGFRSHGQAIHQRLFSVALHGWAKEGLGFLLTQRNLLVYMVAITATASSCPTWPGIGIKRGLWSWGGWFMLLSFSLFFSLHLSLYLHSGW